jgi:hypothetical protein
MNVFLTRCLRMIKNDCAKMAQLSSAVCRYWTARENHWIISPVATPRRFVRSVQSGTWQGLESFSLSAVEFRQHILCVAVGSPLWVPFAHRVQPMMFQSYLLYYMSDSCLVSYTGCVLCCHVSELFFSATCFEVMRLLSHRSYTYLLYSIAFHFFYLYRKIILKFGQN